MAFKSDEICTVALTIFAAIFAFSWFLYSNGKKSRKGPLPPLPPGPRGLPLVGYLPFLGKQLHRQFTELAGVYGPIYSFWLGNAFCVVISKPSLVKEVVRDHDAVFANRHVTVTALTVTYGGNDIAFSPNGPEWSKMRKVFSREMLGNANLNALYPLRRQAVMKTIKDVYNNVGKPTDIGELAFVTAVNAVQRMLCGNTVKNDREGSNVDAAAAELYKVSTELMVLLGKSNISDVFPILGRFDIQGMERQAKKISQRCEEFLDAAMGGLAKSSSGQMRKDDSEKSKSKDFLQIIMELKEQEDSAAGITMDQFKAMLTDIVVAGTDTTSTTVEWAMAELLQHPDVMEKVLEELKNVIGTDKMVEESDLPRLPYLESVIKETFRLHPVVPFLLPRCPSSSCTVGGYNIPKGSKIFLNVWAIHRDPEFWENPLGFQPQRFLDNPAKFDFMGNNFQYMPFGSGRRICAGLSLAERMLTFMLASLLHSFEWKLQNGAQVDLSDKFGLVTKKQSPLVAVPTPRLSKLELYHQL